MKYKEGDSVKIKNDLIVGKMYDYFKVSDKMNEWRNRTVIIDAVLDNGYLIDTDTHYHTWTDAMLEPVETHICDCKCTGKEYLTTKQFISQVENLGFRTVKTDNAISIKHKNIWVSRISINNKNSFGVLTDETINDELFDLCIRYARTPLEKRVDKKQY